MWFFKNFEITIDSQCVTLTLCKIPWLFYGASILTAKLKYKTAKILK